MAKPTSSKPKYLVKKVNIWAFLQSVFIEAMRKGQLPGLTVALIVVIILVRLPEEDLSKLAFATLQALSELHILGWLLFVSVAAAWFFHSKWQRRSSESEVTRLADEKTDLQRNGLGADVKSSSKKQNG